MKNMRITCIVWVWMLCVGALYADPLVLIPDGNFSCIVEVASGNSEQNPTGTGESGRPDLRKASITQVGKLRRDIFHWSDNSTSDLWTVPENRVSIWESNAEAKDVYLLRGELLDAVRPKLLRLTPESFSWVTPKALAPGQKENGSAPLHYRARVVVAAATGDRPAATELYQVWVDRETLLPLKLADENAIYTLEFSKTPPSSPLVMPPKIKGELELWVAESTPRRHR